MNQLELYLDEKVCYLCDKKIDFLVRISKKYKMIVILLVITEVLQTANILRHSVLCEIAILFHNHSKWKKALDFFAIEKIIKAIDNKTKV